MKYWIGVVSHEHVKRGIKGGFCQVCHGKGAPLRRMSPGDYLIYYSPSEVFREKSPCQKFTAIGQVVEKEPYQFEMAPDFIPWRRDVNYLDCQPTPIVPLIEELTFIRNKKSWGYPFRFGLLEIPEVDFRLIAKEMSCEEILS